MIPEFEALSAEEAQLMVEAPALITILIAGADDKIDRSEIRQAVEFTHLKETRAREELLGYYHLVNEHFEEKLNSLLDRCSQKAEEHNPFLFEDLKKINDILPKIGGTWPTHWLASMRGFAKSIAEASGGVFGFMPVGYEENKLIDLDFITVPSN